MSFDNKDAFTKALDNYDITKGYGTRATGSFYSADDIYNNSSGEDAEIEKIGFLVPDEKFRHFLNKNLEIIVNDTLYRITKDGTFFAHLSDKEELEKAVKRVGDFTRTANDLKELGNVRLKNTFNTWDGDSLNPINDENYFDEESDDVIIPNNHFQYCQRSTPVLSKEYCSTFRGVLQYFHGSTGTRGNCSSFNYRMSCLECFILVYPFSR